jgi:pimeloyl-ACP methyl ester carboxylesterase
MTEVPPERAALLLHGFFSLPLMMTRIGKDLRQCGYHISSPYYPSWRWPLIRIIDDLAVHIACTPQLRTARRLDIIAHSMGGLVARALIARHRPLNLGRVICLGTPHGGSEIADRFVALAPFKRLVLGAAGPVLVTHGHHDRDEMLGTVDYPLANIAGTSAHWEGPTSKWLASPNDGKVSLASTHCTGESAHLALPVPHRLLPFDGGVRRQILAFLKDGTFA